MYYICLYVLAGLKTKQEYLGEVLNKLKEENNRGGQSYSVLYGVLFRALDEIMFKHNLFKENEKYASQLQGLCDQKGKLTDERLGDILDSVAKMFFKFVCNFTTEEPQPFN
jgi:hypothetical protein